MQDCVQHQISTIIPGVKKAMQKFSIDINVFYEIGAKRYVMQFINYSVKC